MFNQKGAIPIPLLIAVIGIVAFLAFTSAAPLKDKLLTYLYPKPHVEAVLTPAQVLSKKSLIFSVDQGWINGITQTKDLVGLDRMIAAIKPLQSKYQVFLLYSPINSDPLKIKAVLDKFKGAHIPFIFDAMTSDARVAALGNPSFTFNKVADPVHGLILTVAQLQNYKDNYGELFAGVRVMEPFVVDRGVRNCTGRLAPNEVRPAWCKEFTTFYTANPGETFFKKSNIENILAFAKKNNMFAIISDAEFPIADSPILQEKQWSVDLTELLGRYPAMVVLNYETLNIDLSDNTPGNTLHGWNQRLKNYVTPSSNFFGLSNQQYCKLAGSDTADNYIDCPMDIKTKWTTLAFEQGAVLVQFEPSWWFLQFPKGIISGLWPDNFNPYDYTQDLKAKFSFASQSAWGNRGYPRNQFTYLAKALGVDLSASPTPTPTPLPAPAGTPYPGTTNTPKVTKVSSQAVCTNGKPGVKVSWTNPSGMLGYHRIFRIGSGNSAWLAVGWTDGSLPTVAADYTDFYVSPGQYYAYAIETYVRGYSVPSGLAIQENPTWPLVLNCN